MEDIKGVLFNIGSSSGLEKEIELLKDQGIKVSFLSETDSYLSSTCKIGIAPCNCLAVDSSKEGLLESKNVGMQTLCVYPDSSISDFSQYSISSIGTLLYFLEKYVIKN